MSSELRLNIPGSSAWTEEEWEQLAAAVGATLAPLPKKEEEE